jgi:tRNA-modifying protein YgfZ
MRMHFATDPQPLGRAELIEISGPDALAFAQAQFTSDVTALDVAHWQWSAWLSAQGRARAVFALLRIAADRLLVWMPLGDALRTRDAVARFVLRAKVKLDVVDGVSLHALDADTFPIPSPFAIAMHANGHAFAQPGSRVAWLGPPASIHIDAGARDAWHLSDIDALLPWLDRANDEAFVPQALDLDVLGAVRFDKGCYPGQEIAARLHFRGGNKQLLRRVRLDGAADVVPGLAIAHGAQNVGSVLYAVRTAPTQHRALAVVTESVADDALLTTTLGHGVAAKDA